MSDWGASVDVSQVKGLTEAIALGLADTKKLHTWYVIQTQGWIFRHWPTSPPLAPITVGARRKRSSEPLLDRGSLRLSVAGQNPSQISTAPGTLNEAGTEQGVVGSNLIYAGIQNFGGTIRATRAKNLAIPMTARARAAGSPRNFDGPLVFVPSKKAGVTGLLVLGSKAKPFTLHYVGKKEITRNGKTYRVKNGASWFWIPVSKSAERAGAPSDLGKDLTFLMSKTKDETAYLVEMKERRRTAAQYLLKPSVTIPARPFIPTVPQIEPDLVKVTEVYLSTLAAGQKPTEPQPGGS